MAGTQPFKVIILTAVIFAGITTCIHAQNKGAVTGVIKDAISHTPIGYATLHITDSSTRSTVRQTQADVNGNFVIDYLPHGLFALQVSFVGYETLDIESIIITPGNDTVNLGTINLYLAKDNVLSRVTVTTQKGILQNVGDKKIFQVNQSLVSDGGTAVNLLQNVPTLQIDADGNISLRGSTGVQVFVDGKPSLIAGGTVVQVLQSIPASAIDRVELITNPSAKYDASGQSIVNIVLKANNKRGFNGNAAVTAGTRNNYNSSTGISYQTNKLNVYANYSYSRVYAYSNGIQYITYLNTGNPSAFSDERFPSLTLNLLHNAKVGIDYNISSKSTLGFSASFNARDRSRQEFLTISQLSAQLKPLQFCNCNNTINDNSSGYNLNLDYSQRFNKPGEEITFSLGYARSTNNTYQRYSMVWANMDGQDVATDKKVLQSNGQGNNTLYNIQVDYTLPVGKAGKIEAGYRTQTGPGTSAQHGYQVDDAEGYTNDYSLFNVFNISNRVHALYVSYTGRYKDFSYQAGLRAEDALLTATFVSYDTANVLHATPVKVANAGLYPSILLTQKFKNNQQLQLSYTRRVTRPAAREITTYLDVSDPVNYITGNPGLLPEIIHSVELSYRKNWQSTSVTASAFLIMRNDVIKNIESAPVNDVVVTTAQNLPRSVSTGLELTAHITPLKAWDFTANTNIYLRTNAAAPHFGIAESSGLSWNANITNNLTLVKNLMLQVRADYRSADAILQDLNRPAFGLDAGAKYDFPNKKAGLTLSSRDIFNSRKWAFLRESQTNLLDFVRRTQTSRISLTFTYNFGKSRAATKKPNKPEEQREKRIDEAS